MASVTNEITLSWRFDNTYARLPGRLFVPSTPAPVRNPRVAILNDRLAEALGLDIGSLPLEAAASLFAGQTIPAGALPIAQAYAGHQYGGFTMLGDGRAILLGEHRTPDGRLVDIQFKGSGRTRFSRGGDGRAALGPMLREYVISEAMAAFGIPTTRSLAVVTTGEPVQRETIRQGAMLTRVAASHLRVGTFEYAALEGGETPRILADYAIARHYPDLTASPDKYLDFFRAVVGRQAALVARWQLVGFVHGVMNTDNVTISGETIDYGPCAFMNTYDPDTVFSSIDRAGRYGYGNQPNIMRWNLARLAEALLPLLDANQERAVGKATEVLSQFSARFEGYWLAGMRKKLGLQTDEAADLDLIQSLLDWMRQVRADFTNTFRDLSPAELPASDSDISYKSWHERWRRRLEGEGLPIASACSLMRTANPVVIPRNHRVEEALSAAEDRDDLSVLHRLLGALASPYEEKADLARYQEPPVNDRGYRTFCGT